MSNKEKLNQCVDITLLMYDTAQINSGFTLDKPSDYANKVNRLIELGFCEDDEEEDEILELDENELQSNLEQVD